MRAVRETNGRVSARALHDAQLGLPLGRPKVATSGVEAITVGRRVVMVRVVRHPRSRRYVLRMLHDGTLRVTMPPFGSRAAAFAFLRREFPWVRAARFSYTRNVPHCAGVVPSVQGCNVIADF